MPSDFSSWRGARKARKFKITIIHLEYRKITYIYKTSSRYALFTGMLNFGCLEKFNITGIYLLLVK